MAPVNASSEGISIVGWLDVLRRVHFPEFKVVKGVEISYNILMVGSIKDRVDEQKETEKVNCTCYMFSLLCSFYLSITSCYATHT